MRGGREWRIPSQNSSVVGGHPVPTGMQRTSTSPCHLHYCEPPAQEVLLSRMQPLLTWDRYVYKDPFPFMELKSCLKAARISLLFLLTWEVSRRQDIFIFIFSTSRVPGPSAWPPAATQFFIYFTETLNIWKQLHGTFTALNVPSWKLTFPSFFEIPHFTWFSQCHQLDGPSVWAQYSRCSLTRSEREYPHLCSFPSFIHSFINSFNKQCLLLLFLENSWRLKRGIVSNTQLKTLDHWKRVIFPSREEPCGSLLNLLWH